jgi:hypothetical protein
MPCFDVFPFDSFMFPSRVFVIAIPMFHGIIFVIVPATGALVDFTSLFETDASAKASL